MKATPFYRRRPLLCALLLLLVSSAILLPVALSRLDLDQLRQRLAQEMSQVLHQPVEMGELHLTYQQGLAISIHNLNIGDSKDLEIRIPQLTGVLRLQPLLNGKIQLDRVVLNKPQLSLALTDTLGSIGNGPELAKSGKLFKSFGLSTLVIHQANLDLVLDTSRYKGIPSKIENLNLILRGWETEQSGSLIISGELPGQKGQFTAETELPPAAQLSDWRRQPLSVKANLSQLSRDLLPRNLVQHLPERIDAAVTLSGPPTSGIDFSGHLKDHLSGKQLAKAEGRWVKTPQSDDVQKLQMQLFDIPLEGQLQINRTADGAQLQGSLKIGNVPLPQLLKRWKLPQADRLVSGTVKSAEIQFSGALGKGSATRSGQRFQHHIRLRLEDGRWALTDTNHLEQISLEAELDNQTLVLKKGSLRLYDQPLSFQGKIRNWKDAPLFSLDITARPEASFLREFVQDSLPESLLLSGPLATTLNIEGNRELIRATAQINLDDLHAEMKPLIIKQPEVKSLLTLKGTWQPNQVEIEQATLDLADAHIEGTASIPLGETSRSVGLQVSNIDLAALRPHSPLLQRLKSQGVLSLALQRHETGEFQGELALDNVGVHLTRILADLNSANGRVTLNHEGLDFDNLNARLGQSPIQVDGKLRNWSNFMLDLKVRSKKIRARDLIFANQEMTVYDLDGKLLINKSGIVFDPVLVRLENGTDATVSGYVRNFSQPDTYLEIESFQHADILEVINLFVGPPRQEPASKTPQGKPIRILARAAQGTLGGLKFQEAEGMIVSRRGLFTLYPLRFKHRNGFCLSRVEYEQGLLKISGHLENFDASTLYSEALQAKGLVTGKLRGDFYLEGEGTGDKFWASSRGGAHLEIRDGALRKFRGLAQIFSLLNVSQLFELKLPDMDREGMPFTLLTGSVKLQDGILSTSNLHIKSNAMNMSAVGNRNLVNDTINLVVGVKPLRTVDKIITAIPIAGWLLGGEEKALLTAHFKVKGAAGDPEVTAIPVSSVSKTILGLLKRTLELPGTLISDPDKLFFPALDEPQAGPPAEAQQTPKDTQNQESEKEHQ